MRCQLCSVGTQSCYTWEVGNPPRYQVVCYRCHLHLQARTAAFVAEAMAKGLPPPQGEGRFVCEGDHSINKLKNWVIACLAIVGMLGFVGLLIWFVAH